MYSWKIFYYNQLHAEQNYNNMVNVVNKTLQKIDNTDKVEEIKIVITDVETNNENVVEEVVSEDKIIKSPIKRPRNNNNLKKRKKKKHKK